MVLRMGACYRCRINLRLGGAECAGTKFPKPRRIDYIFETPCDQRTTVRRRMSPTRAHSELSSARLWRYQDLGRMTGEISKAEEPVQFQFFFSKPRVGNIGYHGIPRSHSNGSDPVCARHRITPPRFQMTSSFADYRIRSKNVCSRILLFHGVHFRHGYPWDAACSVRFRSAQSGPRVALYPSMDLVQCGHCKLVAAVVLTMYPSVFASSCSCPPAQLPA